MLLSSVVSIIVTYNPDFECLRQLVSSVLTQVTDVIIVDNGSKVDVAAWAQSLKEPRLHIKALGVNQGIAAAHNVGIEWARQRNAAYVLILDHDSIPLPDMVAQLQKVAQKKMMLGEKLAAVGPRFVDARRIIPLPFIRIEGFHLRRCKCYSGQAVPVDYLISSGSLIPMSTLNAVGGMEEKLFIDYVDIEWGLRAKKAGFQSYGVFDAVMNHSLGDKPLRFLFWQFPARSPMRHYYMMRNAVWLFCQKEMPCNWKFVEGLRLIRRFCCYALLARPQGKHLTMMLRGLWDGCQGRMGKFIA